MVMRTISCAHFGCQELVDIPNERGLCRACRVRPACSRCGMPNSLANRSKICAACRHEEQAKLNRGRPDIGWAELSLLREKLRIHPEVHPRIECYQGERFDDRWSGFRVELVHFAIDAFPRLPWGPVYHPWVEVLPGRTDEHVIVRWRAWQDGTSGFAEVWWEPRKGTRQKIQDFDHNAQQAQFNAFLALLRTKVRPGPRTGGRFENEHQCRDTVITAIMALWEQGRAPRAADVELYLLGVESAGRQLRRYLKPYKYKAILDDVRKNNPELW